jgi:hypothetical protein
MSNETVAAFLFVLVVGLVVGWCAGWIARTEQNRLWHRGALRQLAAAQTELTGLREQLAEALDELDDARDAQYHHAHRGPTAPAVVHVHVAAPGPWSAPGSVTTTTTPFLDELDAMPVLPAKEVPQG